MGFNSEITGPQKVKLRSSSYSGKQNVSLFSNAVVFKAQVNTDLTDSTSWESLAYNNVTVGAYGDIELGMTVLISLVDDIQAAIFRGRIHSEHFPTNVTLYLNENDAKLPVGAYIFVIDVFEVFDMLSRPVGSTPPVQEVDYDLPYANDPPSISGLQYVYAGDCNSVTGKLRVTLALTGAIVAAGPILVSWQIIPRAGTYTLISGSLSSPNAVIDFNPGETWFQVLATDDNGVIMRRHSGVKAHDADNPPDLYFENIDISGALDRGWTARCPAFYGVADVLPWTLGAVWRSDEFYGGASGALGASNNIDFIGYLRKDDPRAQADRAYGVLSSTTFEMVDIANRMQPTEMQQLAIRQNLTPDEWDEIADLTVRRGLWHMLTQHSTIATLVDITFDDQLSSLDFLFPVVTTQGNNLLAACNGIANQVNAAVEFAKDGRIYVPRDARQLTAIQRADIPTIMDFTEADGFTVISASRNYENNVGVLDANGAVALNGSATNNVQAFMARAPGMAQGQSQGQYTLANQILAVDTAVNASRELRQRAGNEYEIRNLQETLTVEFADGYTFLECSRAQFYTFTLNTTLDGPNGVNRIIYDDSVLWLCEQFSFNHTTATGSRKPTGTFRRVSRVGDLAYPVPIPAQPTASILPFSFQFIPAAFPGFNPMLLPHAGFSTPPPVPKPSPKKVSPVDGNTDVMWTASQIWITRNYIGLTAPVWIEITPHDLGSWAIKHAVIDLFTVGTSTPGVYVLASNGTDSAVWHTTNALLATPVWTKGDQLTGVYSLIRATNAPGTVEVYTTDVSSQQLVYDFTISNQGWVLDPTNLNGGVYVPGVGWRSTQILNPSNSNYYMQLALKKTISSTTVVGYSTDYDETITTFVAPGDLDIIYVDGSSVATRTPATATDINLPWSGSVPATTEVKFYAVASTGASPAGGLVTLKKIIITTTIGGGGDASTALSTDNGATWSAPVTVGATPGVFGGFDVQHGGTVSIAAGDENTYEATTFGGAYSVDVLGNTPGAQPILLTAPWYQWLSTTVKNTGSTPHYLLGSSALVGSDSLWRVDASSATAITPAVGAILVGPNAAMIWKGTRIAVLASVSGVTHLYTSINGGVAWIDRGAMVGATYIRGRYFSPNGRQLFIGGAGKLWYSPDFGATLIARTPPVSSGITGIECFG